MSNNTYNYSPHINCTNEITNSSDDKLVAHYKFDDIVEPTENIISNPLDPTKWQTTTYMDKNYGFISHRFVDTDLGVKGYERTIDSSDWRATMVMIPWQPITDMDSDYTFSIYVRALENIEGAEVYLNYEGKNSTGTRVDVGKTYYFSNSNWQRIELTANLKSCDFVSVLNYMKVYLRSNNGKQVTIQIALPQMEKKSYSTEFTEDIRLGQVLDYSLNNNHGLMELEAYPKISNDSPNDSLSYIFDGVDDFIKIPKYNLPDNATIALWVKTSTTYGSQIIIGDSHSISFGFHGNYLIGYAGTPGTTKPTGSYGSCFKNNEWNHLAVTIENGNLSYYCNGSKISTGSLNNWIWSESDYAYIGRRTENSDVLPYYFRGNMDDLRIYGRVLSDSEIRSIYYSRK